METKATAAIVPQLVPVVVTNSDNPVGIVLAYTLVKVEANKYSFHANRKLNKDVTAIPGAARGMINFQNIVNIFAPSTIIASSNSFGIPSIITLFPIYWMVLVSTRTPVELFGKPNLSPTFLNKIHWKNFTKPFIDGIYSDYLINSIIVATSNALLVTTLALMATYASVSYTHLTLPTNREV